MATLPDLVARARAGDEAAQEGLIEEYADGVARFVALRTGPGAHCEDLCQTIFVKMLLGLPRLRSEGGFEGWLLRIARNACTDHLRQRRGWRRIFVPLTVRHEEVAADAAGAPTVVPTPMPTDFEAAPLGTLAAVDRLPASERTLLLLSLEGKKSYQEMARLENLTVPAVKSRLFRARRKLKQMIRGGGDHAE